MNILTENTWLGPIEGFGGPEAEAHYPPDLSLEPINLIIKLKVDIDREFVQGEVTTTVLAHASDKRRIILDAVHFENLAVRDGHGRPLTWSYDGHKIEILWDEVFAPDERRDLIVSYQVEHPATGLHFMKPSAAYPQMATYAATDHETERARYWLPCIDLPNVRPSLDFHLTAAANLTILANGALLGETVHDDGTKTAHWRLEQRCPSYITCFAIGDFVRCDDGEFEGVPISYFAVRDFTADDLKRSFGRTGEMLAWMTKKLDMKYPYPKYYQFALPNFSGAMENISLVSWNDVFVLDEKLAPEWSWIVDQTNVHEMAHMYFGDLVVCRDYAHVWLKESWATYIETCWLEDKKGEDEYLYDLYRNAHAYMSEADERYMRPIVTRHFTSSWQMYDRHLYPGGACRLHMLRQELGDEVFWKATQDYLKTYREKVVETDDFRRMLEKHSGKSLQQFFDQWFLSAGYPDLKVSFNYDREKKIGTFEVVQQQVKKAREQKQDHVPVFAFTTDLAWVIDGELISQSVHITKERQSFTIAMVKDPEQVRFDPFWKALHKLDFNPGDEKLRCQLKDAKDVVGRIHAALTLAQSGRRENVQALLEAWKNEPFWGVRRELVKALETSETQEAVRALAQIVADEKHPLVLDRVFASAAHFRDEALRTAIEQRLDKGTLGPIATRYAYLALGAQRGNAPLKLLLDAAQKEAPYQGFAQLGALQALGETRQDEAFSYLAEAVRYGKLPYRIRKGAVAALGQIASHLDKHHQGLVEETLIDLLRDQDLTIRTFAARALKDARGSGSISALEAYRATLAPQEQVEIDHVIKSLKSNGDGRIKSLEKQLEELTVKFRKLDDRLDDLEQPNKG